ncbi:biotin--[acetyl-CoA-carboxylase] ligase [Arvimicrobium flavum]|uniref:biotin--[acetyl-CoA-carboxylase] ligase n=1 Tax=Arvimicrobium flavum TaxID=3393320 RepID=UPI00237A77BC|nr:biotin--[acetyl-CoA-carboxylase] ligase [Mesorhizobium shangrilense]
MAFVLGPKAAFEAYRLEAYESVGSTNAIALERARAGDPGNLWVVAKQQESGRGRRGRDWCSPYGNLAATLLVVGRYDLRLAATLGFVAGLALADALAAVMSAGETPAGAGRPAGKSPRFELKWPNDVLADGAKLSGILLESHLLGDGRIALAIGTGVNVVAHPLDAPYPVTSLAALELSCEAEALFGALSDAWTENFQTWNAGHGLPQVRSRWLDRAAGLGRDVTVNVGGEVKRGVFETIDENGCFVIRDQSGAATTIAAGDVHFGTVASAR